MGVKVKKCVVITGAPETDIEYYKDYIEDRYVISADSGFCKCERLGITPDLIVGDFDSSDVPQTDIETIVLPSRKDDTDTFFAVKQAVSRGFSDIIILGAIGSRIDHTYSNMLCLGYCLDHNIFCAIVNKKNKIFSAQDSVRIRKGGYKYFSVFPFFDKCTGVCISGAQYSLNDYTLDPYEQIGQSNECKDDYAVVSAKTGRFLIILSND